MLTRWFRLRRKSPFHLVLLSQLDRNFDLLPAPMQLHILRTTVEALTQQERKMQNLTKIFLSDDPFREPGVQPDHSDSPVTCARC